jgi:hypothetical protein
MSFDFFSNAFPENAHSAQTIETFFAVAAVISYGLDDNSEHRQEDTFPPEAERTGPRVERGSEVMGDD